MKKIQTYGIIIFASFLFALSLNVFIVPHGLYNGGFVGIAQIINTLLEKQRFGITINLVSLINLLLNIPLFIMSYRTLSKKFFLGSVISVATLTLFIAIIPISQEPLIKERLASCIIGGILTGAGVGLTLTNGASGGGLDIIGVYAAMKFKKLSVGQLQLAVNAIIYTICALLFDLEIAIYSIIYQFILSFVVDKMYFQNIEISAMIFTKNSEIKRLIIEELERGVTYWRGLGGYTHQETEVLVTVISKYEVHRLKRILRENDPNAFMIVSDNLQIHGSYQKRLV